MSPLGKVEVVVTVVGCELEGPAPRSVDSLPCDIEGPTLDVTTCFLGLPILFFDLGLGFLIPGFFPNSGQLAELWPNFLQFWHLTVADLFLLLPSSHPLLLSLGGLPLFLGIG